MTKTELCEKILSYPPTARIDITTSGTASNMPLKVLQELVKEWQEQNVPKGYKEKVFVENPTCPDDSIYLVPPERGQHFTVVPLGGLTMKNIPEPDKDTPPDFNC